MSPRRHARAPVIKENQMIYLQIAQRTKSCDLPITSRLRNYQTERFRFPYENCSTSTTPKNLQQSHDYTRCVYYQTLWGEPYKNLSTSTHPRPRSSTIMITSRSTDRPIAIPISPKNIFTSVRVRRFCPPPSLLSCIGHGQFRVIAKRILTRGAVSPPSSPSRRRDGQVGASNLRVRGLAAAAHDVVGIVGAKLFRCWDTERAGAHHHHHHHHRGGGYRETIWRRATLFNRIRGL